MSWNTIKRDKRRETGIVENIIDFSVDGGGTFSNETTKISHVQRVLKNFKNPYVGNKRKLIPFLVNSLQKHNVEYDTVIDLFSGSAFVSMIMKMLDKTVISNDILSSSYLNSIAFVKNKDIFLKPDEIAELFTINVKLNNIDYDEKYLCRFSPKELEIILNFYQNTYSLFGRFSNNDIKMALAITAIQNYIIEKCFVGGRLSNNQILAHYDYRLKHARNNGIELFSNGKEFSYKSVSFVPPIFPNDKNIHQCYNMDAIDLLKNVKPQADLIYIDPPYGGLQSDYGFMYSFFEEMLYDCSYSDIMLKNKKLKRFVDKSNYEKHFDKLIESCQYLPNIAISYNNHSWGNIDSIVAVINKYRNNVIIEEYDYSYNYRRHKSKEKVEMKEYLIISKDNR